MDVKRKKFGFTPLEMKVSNRGSNRFLTGFTLAEILTVLGIIALLVGLLLPALGWVRRVARETKQKAQLTTIGLTLEAFKNDDGDYPPSDGYYYGPPPLSLRVPLNYCGAQKLAEALLGWDLLGVHPDSHWQADGKNSLPYWDRGILYPPDEYFFYDPASDYDMDKRSGPYLELATINAFRLGDLFDDTDVLAADRFVICDVFGIPERRITLANDKTVTPGTPILYYRADTSSKRLEEKPDFAGNVIYDFRDNSYLIGLGKVRGIGEPITILTTHLWAKPGGKETFYEYIKDPKITATDWPYRPDSYILISAGADGLYGTGDDITNFGN